MLQTNNQIRPGGVITARNLGTLRVRLVVVLKNVILNT